MSGEMHIPDAVSIQNLNFRIGGREILKNAALQIPTGALFALVGNNGAGKTTLLKILLGLELQYQGEITLFGSRDLAAQRRKIGAVMSILRSDPLMRGREYLHEMCLLCGADPKTEIERAAALTECTGYLDKRLNACSDGMHQRIMIAGALVGSPELLVLDEPFRAIDPYGMENMRILLRSLHKKGVTIIVASHILTELVRLTSDFGVICEGEIKFAGTAEQMKAQQFRRYLYAADDLAAGIRILRQDYPQLCTIPYCDDNIAVIAQTPPELPAQYRFCGSAPAETGEILRFYMSGKEPLQ